MVLHKKKQPESQCESAKSAKVLLTSRGSPNITRILTIYTKHVRSISAETQIATAKLPIIYPRQHGGRNIVAPHKTHQKSLYKKPFLQTTCIWLASCLWPDKKGPIGPNKKTMKTKQT